jgi:hypothetical protein
VIDQLQHNLFCTITLDCQARLDYVAGIEQGALAMKRMKTEIYSIFGQIEGVIADEMSKSGKVRAIDWADIPEPMRFDDRGRRAHCALIMNRVEAAEFDRRVAALRA